MAYNPVQQRAVAAIWNGGASPEEDAKVSLAYLQAYGAGAIAVSGPKSAEFWKPYAHPTKFEGVLPRTVYQFIVLTIARATGADYEWHDHIAHARAAGLSDDVIEAVGSGRAAQLPEPYALVHAILTKTTAWQVVPDDLQARAAAQWGRSGLVELVVLSGFYQMFAAINQGFAIGVPPASGQ